MPDDLEPDEQEWTADADSRVWVDGEFVRPGDKVYWNFTTGKVDIIRKEQDDDRPLPEFPA